MNSILFPAKVFFLVLSIFLLFGCSSGFGPDYDDAAIKQNIGGTLICNSVHTADIQNYQYDVRYQYKRLNNSVIDIGAGTYYNRKWEKDEQLVQFQNWIILKTGDWFNSDKIIMGNLKTDKWTEYKFSPENIETDRLWRASKIHSLLNYCCSETFIDNIKNGLIELHYKFRTKGNLANEYATKKIFYKIDDKTGEIAIVKIE